MTAHVIPIRPPQGHPMANAGPYGFEAPEPVERFTLRPWSNGYVIYDRGQLICTFHGPQWGLASATLKRLREDAGRV